MSFLVVECVTGWYTLLPSHGDIPKFQLQLSGLWRWNGAGDVFPALEAGGGVQEGRVLIGIDRHIGDSWWCTSWATANLRKRTCFHFGPGRNERRTRAGEDAVHLLAFHPCREDRGPGCRANPLDAGHFSVRVLWQKGRVWMTPKGCDIFPLPGLKNVLHGSW